MQLSEYNCCNCNVIDVIKLQESYQIPSLTLSFCPRRFPSLSRIIGGVFWPWSGWSQNAETTSTAAHTCTRNSRRSCWPPSLMREMWWSANKNFTRWPKPTGRTHTTAGGRVSSGLTASGVWMRWKGHEKICHLVCLWMKVNYKKSHFHFWPGILHKSRTVWTTTILDISLHVYEVSMVNLCKKCLTLRKLSEESIRLKPAGQELIFILSNATFFFCISPDLMLTFQSSGSSSDQNYAK